MEKSRVSPRPTWFETSDGLLKTVTSEEYRNPENLMEITRRERRTMKIRKYLKNRRV
jgi:hypothetical protein